MSKRGENIRKRKDGRWEGRYICGRTESGKALYHSVYGKTYGEAKEKLQIKKMEVNENMSQDKGITFQYILNDWLINNRIRYKDSTYTKYKYIIDKHILPELGKEKIENLHTSKINGFLDGKMNSEGLKNEGALSASYVRTMALIIDSALKYAALEELCVPIKSSIKKPVVKKGQVQTLSWSECDCLTQYCYANLNHTNMGILISLNTGLRIGEICALKWSDIDMYSHLLHVNHTMSRLKNDENRWKWIVETPKTQTSIRAIPLSNSLFEALMRIKETAMSDYIVSDYEGFVNPRTYEYRFHTEMKESKVRDVNFHVLRHTFATRCVEGGMDIKTLSEILGHSNVSITLSTYVHSSLELKKTQMEKVEKYFANSGQ